MEGPPTQLPPFRLPLYQRSRTVSPGHPLCELLVPGRAGKEAWVKRCRGNSRCRGESYQGNFGGKRSSKRRSKLNFRRLVSCNTQSNCCSFIRHILMYTPMNSSIVITYQNPSSSSPFRFLPLGCAKACRSYISAIWSGAVASSAALSSRTRINRGKRRDMPRSSTSP